MIAQYKYIREKFIYLKISHNSNARKEDRKDENGYGRLQFYAL